MTETLPINQILCGDCIEVMKSFPAESVDMVEFSPPYYGLRDYGKEIEAVWGGIEGCEHEWIIERTTLIHENRNFSRGPQESVHGNKATTYIKKYDDGKAVFCTKCGAWKGQLGLEPSWQEYILHMVEVCREIKRILKKTGSMYLVIGDTYSSMLGKHGNRTAGFSEKTMVTDDAKPPKPLDYKPKCLMGIPWRLAFALIDDGWILRNDGIWHKPNAMPSSVKDRLTQTYEHIFFFVKSRRYYFDLDAIRQPHATKYAPFNLRVRDVKRGKKGHSASGELKASKSEIENYSYPEKLTKHDIAVRRFPTVNRRGGIGYTDPLHVKPRHPKGKNPGDVFQTRKEPYVGNNPHRMRLEKDKHIALVDLRPMDLSHPKGKNPGDTVNVNPVRHKSWMSTPGHPYAHKPTGKPQNPGDFWSICTKPFKGAHFAVYPEAICVNPIKASCPPNGIVLDPMCGSGTTLAVAKKLGRRYIGIDLNPKYVELAKIRLSKIPEKLTDFL